jgi:signal transduction histidine kinase/predicted RNA-binding protein with RPS1 domain
MGTKSTGLVKVHVTRHLPMGLGVETEDGEHGLIRAREIDRDPAQGSNWQQRYPIGWSGKVVPLTGTEGQVQEFSIRLLESDPWEDASAIIQKGKVYEGIVTGIVGYGAFVEIAPGITGLLHHSRLPSWVKGSPIDLFWPGDRVFVTVQQIKPSERKIALGFAESTRQIGAANVEKDIRALSSHRDFEHEVDLFLKKKSRKKNYVIVEDDPEQSSAMASWLQHLGQHVDVFSNAEDAVIFLEKISPDIAFIDIGLPGMDGLELSRIIFNRWPQVQVVITTDFATAESVMDCLEEAQRRRAELLIKPLMPEDLFSLIRKEDADREAEAVEPQDRDRSITIFRQQTRIRSSKFKKNILDQLRRALGFELAILFAIDKHHRQVTVLESSGDGQLVNPAAIPQLIYSPVRDVAEEQSTLLINELPPHNRDRFRYLIDFYTHLTACIGVPVNPRLPEDFALFVMDRRRQQISPEQKMYAEAAALVLSANLEQEAFNERAVLIQRAALIGQVTRGMVHEIHNLVGPLQTRLEHLQYKLKKLEKSQPSTPAQAENPSILNELSDIENNLRKIITTTRMFARIAAKGRDEVLRIDEIVMETIHLMQDISSQSHVIISFTPPEHLLVSRTQAASLEQVILNVLLNAVQQISEVHSGTEGRIHVWIEPPVEKDEPAFIRILVQDNGPGIHVGQWDRIFEAGFTTRVEGSGIGLYISSNLMEEFGGRLYVKESHILSGTTFCLEIPYHL